MIATCVDHRNDSQKVNFDYPFLQDFTVFIVVAICIDSPKCDQNWTVLALPLPGAEQDQEREMQVDSGPCAMYSRLGMAGKGSDTYLF